MSGGRAERIAANTARMREIAAKFLLRSAADLDVMRTELMALGGGDIAALARIRHIAHRMCGTGATLGFEGLSDCARRIEQLADDQAPAALRGFAVEFDALAAELSRNRSAQI